MEAILAAAQPLRSIDDVIGMMRRIDDALPPTDGLKWFNFLYLEVTEAVKDQGTAGWQDPQWLARLDVIFAGLYFDAIGKPPRAWRPLLDSRRRQDLARIQFALAGMNAHINHDLALAVVRLSEEHGGLPERGSPQHRDFERVNELLETVQARVKPALLTGVLGHVDQHLGRVDDIIALWKVSKARDTAWSNAEVLWELRGIPPAANKFVRSIDKLVGLSSKGLLAPTI